MENKAMNLTFGDYIIIEISLVNYMKELDLSMQSGQYISELLGKIEYELAQIRNAASGPMGPGPQLVDEPPKPGE